MENNQKKQDEKKANWNIKPYLAVGLTAFIVIILSISVFFLIYRYHGLASNWGVLLNILEPIIIGFVIAYLINPIVKWEEKFLLKWLVKRMKKQEKARKLSRGLSITGALVIVFIVIFLLLKMVIPELFASIERMITQLPDQAEAFQIWIRKTIQPESEIAFYLEKAMDNGIDLLVDWGKTEVLPQTKNIVASVTSGIISVMKTLFNVLVGLIISVYILMEKERFVGQAKKLIYTFFSPERGNSIIETVRKSNEIFGGFISGKILDSAIIGVICFIGLYLLKMPYTVLVSVIVGVTNVIPFFGPYIGAIPSAILIALTNPIQGVYFVIFIVILQQIDGNIIGPRILGESTGLSSFWVVFAILVGGGLFGFIGMVLGVPVFATFYYVMKRLVAHILRKKGLPVETSAYTTLDEVDPETNLPDYDKDDEEDKEEQDEKIEEKKK